MGVAEAPVYKLIKKLILSILLSLLFLSLSSQVYADINAPVRAVNGDPSAGSTTKVQMKKEKVTFNIEQPIISPTPYAYTNDGLPVFKPSDLPIKVSAQFSMYNTSDTPESIEVTFPKCDYYSGHNYGCDFKSYSNFTVSVNNQKVNNIAESTENIPSNQLGYCIDSSMTHGTFFKWHQYFPAKQITNVTVTYDFNAPYSLYGYYVDYVLSTGGSWFGNIENGEIIFSFPKTPIDRYLGLTSGETASISPKLTKSITGNTLNVKFSNIKPTVNENLHLSIFDPQERDILDSLEQKAKNDNTANAYNALGIEYTRYFGLQGNRLGGYYTNQAFVYFGKAIDLADNFNDLQQITNSIFSIKNGGDQQEAAEIKSSCSRVDLGSWSQDFCGKGNAEGNWVEGIATYNNIARNTFLKLANKRLSMVPNDAFGMNLKDLLTQITPYPPQPTEAVPTYSENPIPSCAPISPRPSMPPSSPALVTGSVCFGSCPLVSPSTATSAKPSPTKPVAETPAKTTIKILGLNIDKNIISASTIIVSLTPGAERAEREVPTPSGWG